MERRDISQLKDALHAAEFDNMSFNLGSTKITLKDGTKVSAETFVKDVIKSRLRSRIAAPITAARRAARLEW